MEASSPANRSVLVAVATAGLWAAIGYFGSQFLALPFYLVISSFVESLSSVEQNILLTALVGIGLVVLTGVYLRVNDLDRRFIDLELPGVRDLGYVVAGVLLMLGGLVALSLVFVGLGIETSSHGLIEEASRTGSPDLLLAFIPLSLFVVAPTEELFYRNVIQKSLYAHFDRRYAVVIASALFALIHFPAYFTSTFPAAMSTLFALFLISLVLGDWYRRTENLVVPIIVHGIFNSIQFFLAYVQVQYDLSQAMVALVG